MTDERKADGVCVHLDKAGFSAPWFRETCGGAEEMDIAAMWKDLEKFEGRPREHLEADGFRVVRVRLVECEE